MLRRGMDERDTLTTLDGESTLDRGVEALRRPGSGRRLALRLRHKLVGSDESLQWLGSPADEEAGVLHVVRPDGWHCLTNFSSETRPLPDCQMPPMPLERPASVDHRVDIAGVFVRTPAM